MWIARDKYGGLFLFTEKPKKCTFTWISENEEYAYVDGDLLPDVKWEDPEPTKVKIKIIK